MFEIKSAGEKQDSGERVGDKYECGKIFESDRYMNVVKVRPAVGYLQRSWSSDSSNPLNCHLGGEAGGPWRGAGYLGWGDRPRAVLSRELPQCKSCHPQFGCSVVRPLELTSALGMGL